MSVIPTYVLNGDPAAVVVITRELDDDRVEIMWLVVSDPRHVGTLDWAFRRNMDDSEKWTRIA